MDTEAEAAAAEAAEEEFLPDPDDAAAEDFEEEADRSYAHHTQWGRGKPHARLCSIFSLAPEAVYSAFLLQLPPDWASNKQIKLLILRRIEELKQFISTRPEKTNNTYWPLEEKLLPIIKMFYDAGIYQFPELPAITGDGLAAVCLLTSDIATDILQMMLKGDNIVAKLQEMAAQAGAADEGDNLADGTGMSAAEARTMADAEAFGHDSYRAGENILIVVDCETDNVQSTLSVARGTIRQALQAGTVECAFYEVDKITVLDEDIFSLATVWLEDHETGLVPEQTTLLDAWEKNGYLVVPTTNLSAAATQPVPGPRLNNLTKSAVKRMNKQPVKELCETLGLDIEGCKYRQEYVDKVLLYLEQRGSTPPESDDTSAAAVPKLSRFGMKNMLNAMTDFQRIQHMLLGTTSAYQIIRSGLRMQAFLGVFKRAAATATRRSLADRQAVSLAVRPTLEHYLRMSANWWWRGDVAGLRDRSMFKEQMYTAGRGGDIRELEYADRFTYLYHTRPMEAVAIVSIKQNGKTNQNGQLTYQAMIRHKDPRMCAVAAVGLFHMGLFSIMGYEFPDLLGEDKSWYLQPVYPNLQKGSKMNYEEHRAVTRRGLDAVDITGGKSTHLGRQTGSQRIIDAGGSRELAKTHCGWNKADVDLSYLNGPDINALVLEAGYQDVNSYFQSWSILPPPQECLDQLFINKAGLNIQSQIRALTERNRHAANPLHTPLGVAKYFFEAGTAGLQALPILMYDSAFGQEHPIMNHPAINNPAFKAYARRQYQFVKQQQSLELVITPSMGPLLGQCPSIGTYNSHGQYNSILERGHVMHAATTAAAFAEAINSRVSGAGHCVFVTIEEKQLLERVRAAGNLQAVLAFAAAPSSGGGESDAAADTAAPSAAGGSGAAPGRPDGSSRVDGRATVAPAAAEGRQAAAPHVDVAGTASSMGSAGGEAAAAAAAEGDIPGTHATTGAAAGGTSEQQGSADESGERAEAAAARGAGTTTEGASGGQSSADEQPSSTPAACRLEQVVEGLQAEVSVLVGVVLSTAQQQQQQQHMLQHQMLQRSSISMHTPHPSDSHFDDVPDTEEHSQQQQDQSRAGSSHSQQAQQPGTAAKLHEYTQFGLTAGVVSTVPKLLYLFETGWPLGVGPSALTYQALSKSKYTGTIKAQRQQWDLMSQGYTLITCLTQTYGITTGQAAEVVELWRLGKPAAYVLLDGTVTADMTAAGPEGSKRFDNMLCNTKEQSLCAVLKQARGLELVKLTKNPKRAAAGRAGGAASAEAKRRRKAGEGES